MISQQQTGFSIPQNAWSNILSGLYGSSLVWTLRNVDTEIIEDDTYAGNVLHISMNSSSIDAWVTKLNSTGRLHVSMYSYDWADYVPSDDDDDDPDDGEEIPEEAETTPFPIVLRLAS